MTRPNYRHHGPGVRVALAVDRWLSRIPLMERPYYALYRRYKLLKERSWLRWLSRHGLRFAGGDVIDVGANRGFLAEAMLDRLPADCRFHLFEPEPENFRCLERRMKGLRHRVTCTAAAVGDRGGIARLWVNPHHHFDHRLEAAPLASWTGKRISVPVVKLDEHFSGGLPRLRLVKIDVQGYEPAVLRGMRRLLHNAAETILRVEYSPPYLVAQGFTPESLAEELRHQGFGWWYRLGRDGGLRAQDPAMPVDESSVDFLCSRFPVETEHEAVALDSGPRSKRVG